MNKIIFLVILLFLLNLIVISIEQHLQNLYKSQWKHNSYYEDRFDKNSNVTFSFFANFKEFKDLILDCNQTYNITNYVTILSKR